MHLVFIVFSCYGSCSKRISIFLQNFAYKCSSCWMTHFDRLDLNIFSLDDSIIFLLPHFFLGTYQGLTKNVRKTSQLKDTINHESSLVIRRFFGASSLIHVLSVDHDCIPSRMLHNKFNLGCRPIWASINFYMGCFTFLGRNIRSFCITRLEK